MNPFLLFFSFLIIIVSICLIIFNRGTTLPNIEYSNTGKEENIFTKTEYGKQDSFEKILINKVEPILKFEELIIDNNSLETSSNNEILNEKSETEKIISKVVEINEIDNIVQEIDELKQIGLNNQEIAKKLGKGIREIETILKISNLRKSSNNNTKYTNS